MTAERRTPAATEGRTESWLDAYLAFSPHFSLHPQGRERLLLLSEERSFRLNGAVYLALVPLLDGRLRGHEIVARLSGVEAPEALTGRLRRMLDKSYITAVAPGAEMNRQAYWSSLGATPADVTVALANVRLAIVSVGGSPASDAAAAKDLSASLADLGLTIATPDTADLTLVLVDDYLQPTLREVALTQGRAERSWVPFKPGGAVAWLGPVIGGKSGHCYACLGRRLLERRPGDTVVATPQAGVRPARAWLPQTLAAARGLASLELARLGRGADSRIARGLVTWDLEAGTATVHAPPRFADCPNCGRGSGADAAAEPRPIRLASVSADTSEDAGWRTLSAAEALRRLEPLVSPLTGIVDAVEDNAIAPGLHVCSARHAARLSVDPRANRRLGRPEGASGKGTSAEQARASCLAEAQERYACGWTGTEPRRVARLAELGEAAPHPHRLLEYSEYQYAHRERLNADAADTALIPVPFDESAAIEWSPAWSLRDDAPRWLPSRYCYYTYGGRKIPGDHEFCMADSNGCATGGNREEAILQGLLELVERDGVALWWYNRLQMPELSLEGIDDRFVERMTAHYTRLRRDLHLIDLTTDLGIPAAAAISIRHDGRHPLLGLGAHLEPRIAALRALTELNQALVLESAIEAGEQGRPGGIIDDFKNWLDRTNAQTMAYLRPRPGAARRIGERACDATSIDAGVRFCVERLAAHGHDVIVLDYDRADLPLACARVVVPGLRHFWNRRAPGRLYDVPVRLGWLPAPLAEADLNPVSFFL